MAKTILGKVSINPLGVWNEETLYTALDAVSLLGSSYISLVGNNSAPLSDTDHWMSLASKGDTGAAFTYEDFTPEQLALLALTFDKLTPEQKKEIEGKKGDPGDSAFKLWQREEGNEAKTYEEYKLYVQLPALTAAKTAESAAGLADAAAKKAQDAASEVQDGKTPVIQTGTTESVPPGSPSEISFIRDGENEEGQPIYTSHSKLTMGNPGKNFQVLGYYDTLADLQTSVITPVAGDTYGIGTEAPYLVYVYDGIGNTWKNNGAIQGPAGSSGKSARINTTTNFWQEYNDTTKEWKDTEYVAQYVKATAEKDGLMSKEDKKKLDDGATLFPLIGKKMLVLGDSLSSASGGSMESPAIGSWCQYVKALLDLSDTSRVIAQGGATCTDRSGTTIKPLKADWGGDNNVLSNQVYSVINHYKTNKGTAIEFVPDIIMIMIGTNNSHTTYPDPMWSSTVGDWKTCMYDQFVDTDFDLYDLTDSDKLQKYTDLREKRKKFYYAYRWAIEALLFWFPNASIYVLSPMANSGGRGQNIYEYTLPACLKVADFLSCGYIDVYSRSGLSYYSNTRQGNGWDKPWYTFDGTHPNFDAGMELVGRYVAKELQCQYFVKPAIKAIKVPMSGADTYYTISIVNANASTVFGTTNPSAIQQVIKGGSLTVNIIPADGCYVYSVEVDGVEQGEIASYTFDNVQANHELLVEFAQGSIPVLTSVSINSGASTTYDTNVIVLFGVAGPITHYKLSETSDLSGLPWIEGQSKTLDFALSSDYGPKTVYAQVKNLHGESNKKSSSIVLQERPAVTFTVTGQSNNDAYGIVIPATQEIAQGGNASLTATAKSGYIIESWANVTSSTGVGTASGSATLVNLQGDKIVTCNFRSDGKVALSFGWAFNDNGVIEDGITKVNMSNITTPNDKIPVGIISMNGKGATNYANVIGKITGDNSGIYPDKFLERSVVFTGTDGGNLSISNMVNGTYKIGILSNISSTAAWASYVATPSEVTIDINGAQKNPAKIIDNTDALTVFENIAVTDGVLRILINIPTVNKRFNVNVIEIEKIS